MSSQSNRADPLGDIIAQSRCLLIDFDGPICSLFAGTTTAPIADRLRKVITNQGTRIPQAIETTGNWFEILGYAASISPNLAASVEVELAEIELAAVPTAAPTPYAHDVVMACRESGRTIAIISNNSATAVHAYLDRQGLSSQIRTVAARITHDPAILKPDRHLVDKAASVLGVEPAACTVVGDSLSDIQAAQAAGVRSIGYANKPGKHEPMTAAGAGTVINSMASLARSLRARPLPY